MNREIKFRAWDNKSKIMSIGLPFNWFVTGDPYDMEFPATDESLPLKDFIEYLDDFILMQYTGLKDKNGKEIYEMDIVNCLINGVKFGATERIEFQYGRFILRHRDIPVWEFEGLDDGLEIEVIGNIYENSDLLSL